MPKEKLRQRPIHCQPNHSTEYFVPPHDPILGILDKHIAPAIDETNWKNKAVVTQLNGEPQYLYIVKGEVPKLNRTVFCATGYSLEKQKINWRHKFFSPEDAITWIKHCIGNRDRDS